MKEKFFQNISSGDVDKVNSFLSENQKELTDNAKTWNEYFNVARKITNNKQILNLLDEVQNNFHNYYIDSSDDEGTSMQTQVLPNYIAKFNFPAAISTEAFLSKLGLLLHDFADSILKNKSLPICKQYNKMKAEYLSLDKAQADNVNQNIYSTLVEVIPNVIKQGNQYVLIPEESQTIFNSIFNPYIEPKRLIDNLKKPDILAIPLRQGRNKNKKYVDEELLKSIQGKVDTSFLKPSKDIHFIRAEDQRDASDLLAFSQVVNRVNKNLLKHIKISASVDWSTSSKFTLPKTILSPFHTGYDINYQNSNIQVKEIAGLGAYSKFIFPEIRKIDNKPLFVDTIFNIVKNQQAEPLANKHQALFAEQLVHLLFFVEMQRSASTLFTAPIFLSLVKGDKVDFLQVPEKYFPMAIEKAVALIRRVMLAHHKKELLDTRLLDYDRDIDTSKSGSNFSKFLSLEGGQLIMWLPDDNQFFTNLKTFIHMLDKIALLTKLNKESHSPEEIKQIDCCFTECVQQKWIQQKPELVNMDAVRSVLEKLSTIKTQNTPTQDTWNNLLKYLLSQLKPWYNIDCNLQQLLKAAEYKKDEFGSDEHNMLIQESKVETKKSSNKTSISSINDQYKVDEKAFTKITTPGGGDCALHAIKGVIDIKDNVSEMRQKLCNNMKIFIELYKLGLDFEKQKTESDEGHTARVNKAIQEQHSVIIEYYKNIFGQSFEHFKAVITQLLKKPLSDPDTSPETKLSIDNVINNLQGNWEDISEETWHYIITKKTLLDIDVKAILEDHVKNIFFKKADNLCEFRAFQTEADDVQINDLTSWQDWSKLPNDKKKQILERVDISKLKCVQNGYYNYASQDGIWLNNSEINSYLMQRGYVLESSNDLGFGNTHIHYVSATGQGDIYLHNESDIHWSSVKTRIELPTIFTDIAQEEKSGKDISFIIEDLCKKSELIGKEKGRKEAKIEMLFKKSIKKLQKHFTNNKEEKELYTSEIFLGKKRVLKQLDKEQKWGNTPEQKFKFITEHLKSHFNDKTNKIYDDLKLSGESMDLENTSDYSEWSHVD